jgi:hypothetical protein
MEGYPALFNRRRYEGRESDPMCLREVAIPISILTLTQMKYD